MEVKAGGDVIENRSMCGQSRWRRRQRQEERTDQMLIALLASTQNTLEECSIIHSKYTKRVCITCFAYSTTTRLHSKYTGRVLYHPIKIRL